MESGKSVRGWQGQTPLEDVSIRMRNKLLNSNKWKKDYFEYKKVLINSEYNIKTDFLVG